MSPSCFDATSANAQIVAAPTMTTSQCCVFQAAPAMSAMRIVVRAAQAKAL